MITAIYLSDGIETSLEAFTPKQYLPLAGKLVAQHSYEILCKSLLIDEVIVVCESKYQYLYQVSKTIKPGKQRIDTFESLLPYLNKETKMLLIHEADRPLLAEDDLDAVICAGMQYGAAALSYSVNESIKQADDHLFVTQSLSKKSLFEVHTPQAISMEIFLKGLKKAKEEDIPIQEALTFAEMFSHPIKLIIGQHENIKISSPEDLVFAENICRERHCAFHI